MLWVLSFLCKLRILTLRHLCLILRGEELLVIKMFLILKKGLLDILVISPALRLGIGCDHMY